MKYTDKLCLPIWNKPETDVFDIEQFNEGMQAIDDVVIHILNQINDLVIGDKEIDLNGYIKEEVFKELKKKVENKIGKEEIEKINSQLDTKAKQVDLESTNNRIDNLIIHSGEETVKDAEVIDGRFGIDGTSYTLIGNNIRATSKNVNSLISNTFNFKNDLITNLLNKDNVTNDKMIDANGGEVEYSGCTFTNDYLFLKRGESITLNFGTYFTIAKYNINKVFIENIVVNDEDLPYVFTANADIYVRFNVYKVNIDSAMVVKGNVLPNKYIAYGERIPHPSELTFSDYQNVFNIINESYIINLLNKDNMTDGKMIDANGSEIEYTGSSFTNDYLLIRKGESIILNFATYFTIPKYDLNKKFIENIVVNNEDLPYIFSADNDYYLRFNVYNDKKDKAMVVKGKVLPNKYIAYGEGIPFTTDETLSNYQNVFKAINENFITNLLNKNNMTDEKIIDANGGKIEYTSGSFTNDYLLIAKGESITINFATYFTIPCYDLNKNFKTNIVVNDEDLPYIFTADSDMYLRFNVYSKDKDKAMVVKGKNLPSEYIAYGKYVMTNTITHDRFTNVLSGNYLFVGDSICYGAGAAGGYAKLIADKNPKMKYKNIGVSGATICRRKQGDEGTSILNKVEEEIALNTPYNHVILEGGVNDLWNKNIWPLGTYDEYDRNSDVDEMTICGAFESLIRKCKDKWNNAFIYYLIPHSIDRVNTKVGFDTLKSIAKKYNVIVIDLRELSGMDEAVDNIKNSYTSNSDGVHPNENGYDRFYIKPIINILSNYQY